MKNKNFNIVINGVGGQGIITLLQVIGHAAMLDGNDVKTSELHGLSQRGGSVETYLRFGEKVYSPAVDKGKADLVIALEKTEGLRGYANANKNTVFLINNNIIPFLGGLSKDEMEQNFKKIPAKNLKMVDASDICKEQLGKEVLSGIYLFGYAVFNKLIPIKESSALSAIEDIIPKKYLEDNKKAFLSAKKTI